MNEKSEIVTSLTRHNIISILNALFPLGYVNKGRSTLEGPSPYIENDENVIRVCFDKRQNTKADVRIEVLNIEELKYKDECFGFYIGLMKSVAPYLQVRNEEFNSFANAIYFDIKSYVYPEIKAPLDFEAYEKAI